MRHHIYVLKIPLKQYSKKGAEDRLVEVGKELRERLGRVTTVREIAELFNEQNTIAEPTDTENLRVRIKKLGIPGKRVKGRSG